MALGIVQYTPGVEVTGGGNVVVSFPVLPAVGAFIGVEIFTRSQSSSPDFVSVTDNQGNTYHQAAISANSNGNRAAIYYTWNIGAPSGTFSITVDPLRADQQTAVVAVECSGFGTTDPIVGATSATGLSKTPSTGSTGLTGTPETLVLIAMASFSFTFPITAITVEVVAPVWHEDYAVVNGGFNALCGEADSRIVPNGNSQSGSWTLTDAGNPNWGAAIGAFYSLAPGATLDVTQISREVIVTGDTTVIQLTQMARQVLYPFTCTPTPPPPVGSAGCPAVIPLTPVQGESGCADEV